MKFPYESLKGLDVHIVAGGEKGVTKVLTENFLIIVTVDRKGAVLRVTDHPPPILFPTETRENRQIPQ